MVLYVTNCLNEILAMFEGCFSNTVHLLRKKHEN
jgi:hypothetical protein